MYKRYVLLAQVFTHSTCITLGLMARPAYLQLQNLVKNKMHVCG
jgi:hypothetical protein